MVSVFSCGRVTLQEALPSRPSVGPSVMIESKSAKYAFLVADRDFVRPSVGPSVMIKSICGKTSFFLIFLCSLSVGWGLDALAHPSATIL